MQSIQNVLSLSRAAIAFVRVVRDPGRLDEVIELIDEGVARNAALMAPIVESFRATAAGRSALQQRPRVGPIDRAVLARYPLGSLGAAYLEHLRVNGIDPDALPAREARTDAEYVMAHLYETHDIWHVVTGFATDRAGELGLQAFYLAQSPMRMAMGILSIGTLNALLFEFDDYPARMTAIAHGWSLGRRASSLLGVDWASRWAEPLASVRRDFGL